MNIKSHDIKQGQCYKYVHNNAVQNKRSFVVAVTNIIIHAWETYTEGSVIEADENAPEWTGCLSNWSINSIPEAWELVANSTYDFKLKELSRMFGEE